MLGTPIWPSMRVPGPRLKNPSAIPVPIFIYGSAKQNDDKREDDEQTLTELSSAHRHSSPFASKMSVRLSTNQLHQTN